MQLKEEHFVGLVKKQPFLAKGVAHYAAHGASLKDTHKITVKKV